MTYFPSPVHRMQAALAAAGQALHHLGPSHPAAMHFIEAQKHLRWLLQRAELERWDALDVWEPAAPTGAPSREASGGGEYWERRGPPLEPSARFRS